MWNHLPLGDVSQILSTAVPWYTLGSREDYKVPLGYMHCRCGCPRGAPTLKPTAILMASSLILSPREETGVAFSHAPDCAEPAASNLALDSSSLHSVRMVSNRVSILGLSQTFCLLDVVGTDILGGKPCFYTLKAKSLFSY